MTKNIAQVQAELIEDFSFLEDWMDRYRQIIDLGSKLPALADEEMRDEFLLKGCQSKVWFIPSWREGRLILKANSDLTIVAGLIALMRALYHERTAREILDNPPDVIAQIGLSEHLSPTRQNGLAALVSAIQSSAERNLA